MVLLGVCLIERSVAGRKHDHTVSLREEDVENELSKSRAMLFDNLQTLKGHWPLIDEKLLPLVKEGLRLDGKQTTEVDFKTAMGEDFRFDTYLHLQVSMLIARLLQIKWYMWLYLSIFWLCDAHIVQATEGDHLDYLFSVLHVVLPLTVFSVLVYLLDSTKAMEKMQAAMHKHDDKAVHRVRPGSRVIAMLQLSCWCFSYFAARVIARPWAWEHHTSMAILMLFVMLAGLLGGGFGISVAIPRMAMRLARGDLVLQEQHLHWMIVMWAQVLDDKRRAVLSPGKLFAEDV